ncbi:hypothetical protein M3Y99_01641300 [Aphelenchoides fujianensis]|nr:hypothetical protein M3Y99_01641300 [Aphelenchoides fujianensis]
MVFMLVVGWFAKRAVISLLSWGTQKAIGWTVNRLAPKIDCLLAKSGVVQDVLDWLQAQVAEYSWGKKFEVFLGNLKDESGKLSFVEFVKMLPKAAFVSLISSLVKKGISWGVKKAICDSGRCAVEKQWAKLPGVVQDALEWLYDTTIEGLVEWGVGSIGASFGSKDKPKPRPRLPPPPPPLPRLPGRVTVSMPKGLPG